MLQKLLNKFYKSFIISTISGLAISTILALLFLKESNLLDLRFKIRGHQLSSPQIVVITLDETFAKNRNYPDVVPRDYLAEIIDSLSVYGAAVIVLDYEFRVSDRTDESYQVLFKSIEKADNVVLPSLLNPKKNFKQLLPIPPQELRNMSVTGYAELVGKHVQNMQLYTELENTQYEPSLALAAVCRFIFPDMFPAKNIKRIKNGEMQFDFFDGFFYSKSAWDSVLQKMNYPAPGDSRYPINYCGPVYSNFVSHSSEDFLQYAKMKIFPREIVTNKLVLIGSIYSKDTFNDKFTTPVGTLQGVEVHANIMNNLLSQNYLIKLGNGWIVVLSLLAIVVSILTLWKFRLTIATAATFVYLSGYTVLCFVLFAENNLILPVAMPIKAGVLGFFIAYWLFHHRPFKPKIREYLDFEIRLQDLKIENYYQLRVIEAPTQIGNATAEVKITPDREFEKKLKRLERGYVDDDLLKTFGQKLHHHIFINQIANCYNRSLTQARIEKKGLRLRLRIDAPRLRDLPWEYLYDPDNKFFFAANPEILLTRHIKTEQPRRHLPLNELHVLIVISNPHPESLKKYNLRNVDAEYEKELIMNALDLLTDKTEIPIRYKILDHAIPAEIQWHLNQGFHIFHFIGHSIFRDGMGQMVMEDEKCQVILSNENEFSDLFLGQNDVRLALLNSCKRAATSALPEISGIAHRIIDRGVQAVVAMQYPISDQTAILFSREFYQSIANGHPVDVAMSQTRFIISQQTKYSLPHDFGIPVLFMQTKDGKIC